MSIDTITITSTAVIVNPSYFTYASPTEIVITADDLDINFTKINLKLKHLCNHLLDSGQYKLESCPRCLGTGYYYDVKFNEAGQLVQVDLSEKLGQQLEKYVLTEENKFHPEVAINVKQWLGNAPISEIKSVIKFDLIKSLITLQETQQGVQNLAGEVQIGRVDSVEVFEDTEDPMRLHYIIQITTVSGVQRELGGTMLLNRG